MKIRPIPYSCGEDIAIVSKPDTTGGGQFSEGDNQQRLEDM